jgi:hypothetical protein
MTGSMALTAFVQAQPALRRAALSSVLSQAPTALGASTGMGVLNPATEAACISFFEGIKTPATLIAGSSLVALFTMTKDVKQTYGMSKIQIVLLRVYHVLSLLSLCLSLTSVLTSQAATTLLLLNDNHVLAKKGMDAYHFLRTSMNFEFVLTRWSFLTSIILFLCSTTFRMIIEFALFTRKRRLAGTMVVSWMAGILGSILSYANTTQNSWPNFWCMTKEVALVSIRLPI